MTSKKLLLASVICFSSSIALASVSANKTLDVHSQEPVVCELKSQEMGLLDNMLALFPITMVRVKCSEQQARTVQKKIQAHLNTQQRSIAQDQKVIQEQLKSVIEPVKQFFDLIRNYKDVAQPLVKECLATQPYRTGKTPDQSLLYQFFNKQGSIDTLALQEVKSIEDLTILCNDIISLCGCIMKSTSPRSKAAFEKIMKELNNKKQQPQTAGV
jgi:hypothetical protein